MTFHNCEHWSNWETHTLGSLGKLLFYSKSSSPTISDTPAQSRSTSTPLGLHYRGNMLVSTKPQLRDTSE